MSQVSAFGGRITIDKPDFYFSPTESYGILGWVETAIMIVAGIAGVISLFSNPNANGLKQKLVDARLGEVIVIGILLAWYLVVPVLRFFEGELFAIIFSLYVIITHTFLLFGSIFAQNPGQWIFVYALLMILACLIKLMFLFLRKDFEQKWTPRIALYAITVVLLVAYVVLLILQIVNWRTSYDGDRSL
jgi:heme/copper-type cytochrome/quinol oxidase subunit 4